MKTPATSPVSRIRLTASRVAEFSCPKGKVQAFLWDTESPSLALRATPTGRKTYVFESRLDGATLRTTIGTAAEWPLPRARQRASELKQLVDKGIDPRELAREQRTAREAAQASAQRAATAQQTSVGDVWQRYLTEGKPKRRDSWKPRYLADMKVMAAAGGVPKKRGKGNTRPGPLYPLMALPLATLSEDSLNGWYEKEARAGKHQAARAWMMFKGFLRWCAARPEYRALVDRDAASGESIKEVLPQKAKRTDALEAAQIPGWFTGADALANKTIATYLKALLLTGARRQEMAALKWSDVDFQWRKLTLADKVQDKRTIPLTPYMAQLLSALPRVNQFVFASTSKSGHVAEPRAAHEGVQTHAGIVGLTVHGLRRSFSLLGEAAGAPEGAIRQVMGHAAANVAESYRPRSIDALRPYLAQIERHILTTAGITFDAEATAGLRVVSAK